MRLTGKLLTQIERSIRVSLTPEQRSIMLYWYGHELRHGWDEDDFIHGIKDVMYYYPDHRPKSINRLQDFLHKDASALDEIPF